MNVVDSSKYNLILNSLVILVGELALNIEGRPTNFCP